MCACVKHRSNMCYRVPWLQTIYYFCAVVITLVLAECPKTALHDLRLCSSTALPNFGLGPPSGPQAITQGIDMMRESCKSSKLADAVSCMQDILEMCKGTTKNEQYLQMLFDKSSMINTVNYLCNNLDAYEKHASCIFNQHEQTSNCSKEETSKYMMKLRLKVPMDVIVRSTCEYHDEAYACLTHYVSKNCGLEATGLVETVLIGNRPPACDKIEPKYRQHLPNAGVKSHLSSSVLVLTSILYVLHITL